MRLRKGLFGLLAMITLCTCVIVPLSAAPPAFAAGCYASSCTGLDPVQAGCASDAETIYTINGVGSWGKGILQLRYSPSCAAAWAKIYDDGRVNANNIIVENTLGQWQAAIVSQTDGSEYSNMVNDLGSIESQACVRGPGAACTNWF